MWTIEQPSQYKFTEHFSKYSETGVRSRRYHQKSKNGCNYCKQRRIKCDEGKPSCNNCRRKQETCHYPSTVTDGGPEITKTAIEHPVLQHSFDLACVERALTTSDDADSDLLDFLPVARLHAQESLAHFVQCDQPWLKSSKVQQVLQKDAVATVMDRPYLLHSVIALSTAHLAYLNPNKRSYRVASMVHWQHSLRSYSRKLAADIKSKASPAIYFANMIQVMLAFMYSRLPLPDENDMRPNWAVTMQGKKILLDMPRVVDQLSHTIWKPLMQAHHNWQQRSSALLALTYERPLSPTIQALFAHSRTLSPSCPIFDERIRFLAMLERIPPIVDAIGAFVSFMAEAPAEFVLTVKTGEPFALLLVFHWSQIFAKLDQWWIARPAAIERDRLYGYLSQHADLEIRNLVEFLVQNWLPTEKSCHAHV